MYEKNKNTFLFDIFHSDNSILYSKKKKIIWYIHILIYIKQDVKTDEHQYN